MSNQAMRGHRKTLLFLLLFKYSRLHFPATMFPTSHPQFFPPFSLSMGPLYMFSDNSSPPTSSLVTVSLFFISMSLLVLCLLVSFVDQVPLIGEIIWYLSFTASLTSLSIMLSSSIYAIGKGRSSFFLSAAQYVIV